MTSWHRNVGVSFDWGFGSNLLVSIGPGNTFLRCHLRWGFVGDTSNLIDLTGLSSNPLTFGLVTTVGDGSETPPNARTQAADQHPPTQRWIYWETRAPRPIAIDAASGVVLWGDAGSSEPTETKGQVLAQGLSAGQSLNLWATWAAPFAWDPTGSVQVWLGCSTLTKT
jgi:hypothetical protein